MNYTKDENYITYQFGEDWVSYPKDLVDALADQQDLTYEQIGNNLKNMYEAEKNET